MTTNELVNGKGRRVEVQFSNSTMTGVLMGKQNSKAIVRFYVRLDGETRRSLVSARMITRFL